MARHRFKNRIQQAQRAQNRRAALSHPAASNTLHISAAPRITHELHIPDAEPAPESRPAPVPSPSDHPSPTSSNTAYLQSLDLSQHHQSKSNMTEPNPDQTQTQAQSQRKPVLHPDEHVDDPFSHCEIPDLLRYNRESMRRLARELDDPNMLELIQLSNLHIAFKQLEALAASAQGDPRIPVEARLEKPLRSAYVIARRDFERTLKFLIRRLDRRASYSRRDANPNYAASLFSRDQLKTLDHVVSHHVAHAVRAASIPQTPAHPQPNHPPGTPSHTPHSPPEIPRQHPDNQQLGASSRSAFAARNDFPPPSNASPRPAHPGACPIPPPPDHP